MGDGLCDGEGEGVGVGAGFVGDMGTPEFQTNFFPDLIQVNFIPPTICVEFNFVQVAPALTVAPCATFTKGSAKSIARKTGVNLRRTDSLYRAGRLSNRLLNGTSRSVGTAATLEM